MNETTSPHSTSESSAGGQDPEADPGAQGGLAETPDFGTRVLQQLLDLYVTPAVARRQAAGELPRPLELKAAQVLFFPDGRPPSVLVNDEIAARGQAKLRAGVVKDVGDPIYEREVERLESVTLSDPKYANCGHATLMRIADSWHIAFDFRYNKQLSQDHLECARQFLDAATFSIDRAAWASAVDNMFSAAELCSKALLMAFHGEHFTRKSSHGAIHSRINNWAKLGNAKTDHVSAYNRLSNWRADARYLRDGPFVLPDSEARACLAAIEHLHAFATERTR